MRSGLGTTQRSASVLPLIETLGLGLDEPVGFLECGRHFVERRLCLLPRRTELGGVIALPDRVTVDCVAVQVLDQRLKSLRVLAEDSSKLLHLFWATTDDVRHVRFLS